MNIQGNKSQYDIIIVGSGLFGATFAHFSKKAGKQCLVIDKRPNTGGNLYCENIEGINVHKYGAHIFHTSNKKVWDFVNSIVPFNRFTNCPIANWKGNIYNLPFNMNTFHQMWGVSTPQEAIDRIETDKAEILKQLNGAEPSNLEEQALSLVGKDIYEKLIKGYTEKQWGRQCSELPAFIIKRLPLRFSYDNNYFNDSYQGIPIGGYNKLIDGLLEGIDVRTSCDFFEEYSSNWNEIADKLVYTGPIDRYFNYRYGHLKYRSVRFDTEVLDTPNYQGNAVVNYIDSDTPFTRIIEHKHFEAFGDAVYQNIKSVISKEYSEEWTPGKEEFYPINDEENTQLYNKYKALVIKEPNVIFGGRLGEYKYYDMAPIIENVMNYFNE